MILVSTGYKTGLWAKSEDEPANQHYVQQLSYLRKFRNQIELKDMRTTKQELVFLFLVFDIVQMQGRFAKVVTVEEQTRSVYRDFVP